jgi:hypothetical protein
LIPGHWPNDESVPLALEVEKVKMAVKQHLVVANSVMHAGIPWLKESGTIPGSRSTTISCKTPIVMVASPPEVVAAGRSGIPYFTTHCLLGVVLRVAKTAGRLVVWCLCKRHYLPAGEMNLRVSDMILISR